MKLIHRVARLMDLCRPRGRASRAHRSTLAVCACLLALCGFGALLAGPAPALAAASHNQIIGDGSSWAANAVNQWIADVSNQGLQVVYTSTGSAQGRTDFASGTEDFAVSDIGYQGTDPLTGATDSSNRPYVYLPIVAGGTSFPYQIRQGGKLVRNLRLSGTTLAKIFTNQITMWNDAAITSDNNGRQLPAIPIVPVVHSEGSGDTAQFSTYLDTEYPGIWRPFLNQGANLNPGADFTEYWPGGRGSQVSEDGSDNVENFVNAAGSNGAIGYVEYSYPLGQNQPVAKIENGGHYYTLPTQYNVAVALTQANIITDPNSSKYLLQDLTNVYSYTDPRAYPISSYSYAIIPTSATDARMTTAKRQTVVDYLDYSICGGQKELGPIGYSSLPLNLVQAGFNQIGKLQVADPAVDVSQTNPQDCNNPTFDPQNPGSNKLAEIAPQPPACDQENQGPCDSSGSVASTETLTGNSGSSNPSPGPSTPGGGPSTSNGGGGSGGAASSGPSSSGHGTTAAGGSSLASGKTSTGSGGVASQTASGGGTQAGLQSGPTADQSDQGPGPVPTVTNLADGPPSPEPFRWVGAGALLVPLSLVLLLAALVGPPLLTWILDRPRDEGP